MAEQFVFEQAMKRLEEIVRLLERGEAPLAESLTLFEQGTNLLSRCSSALDQAEQKLRLLVKTDGEPELEPFEAE